MVLTKKKDKVRNYNKTKKQIKGKKTQKVKVLYIKPKYTDEYMKSKEGEYFDKSSYDKIINYNCDAYQIKEDGTKKLLFKFRKKVLSDKLCQIGIVNLKKAAMKTHDNRGASAGVISYKKLPTYANEKNQFKRVDKFRILGYKSKKSGKWVNNSFGNLSQSNIIGFFDKRDRNKGIDAPPCRKTKFSAEHVDKWKNITPLIKEINHMYKTLVPEQYRKQAKEAKQTNFHIKNTAFSTVTINYNWRTALHKDAGDYKQGFGNLVVLEEGKYKGGSTGFPQFGVAIDVRHCDFLAMDVHEWHCNTKIEPISKDYTRLSLVSYLRENMIKCKGLDE